MSENTVFKEYHEDGIKLFNKSMNMRQVVNELRDPKHRILNEVQFNFPEEKDAFSQSYSCNMLSNYLARYYRYNLV